MLKLGGDRRHISMLFSDLAGFTSMSEVLEPQKLVAVLNEYLHEMAEIVKAEGGTPVEVITAGIVREASIRQEGKEWVVEYECEGASEA